MDPVVDEKASEDNAGLSYELYSEILVNYPKLVEERKVLLKKEEISQKLIKDVRSENENQKKSMEELKDANAKLKAKKNQQENEISRLDSVVSRLNKEIKQSDEKYQDNLRGVKADNANLKMKISTSAKENLEMNKRCMGLKAQVAHANKRLEEKTEENKQLQITVNALKQQIVEVKKNFDTELYEDLSLKIESLETKLKQQEKYTLTADVQSYMDQLSEASDKIITDLKILHGLEKDVIRIDLKNKAEVVVELQNEVHKLKEENHLLNGIVKSMLEKEAALIKNESRKGTEMEFLKELEPDAEELLKKLAALKEKRRNG